MKALFFSFIVINSRLNFSLMDQSYQSSLALDRGARTAIFAEGLPKVEMGFHSKFICLFTLGF